VKFVDSHVHLTDYGQLSSVLEYCRASETLLLSASIDRASSVRNLELGLQHANLVQPFVGVHPSEAEKAGSTGWLEEAVTSARGVGEVGLDPRYSPVGKGSQQVNLLMLQLGLAESAAKPVQIHTRGAIEACFDFLSSYGLRRVLLHWFEGEELAGFAASRGYYVSIGPALLRSKKVARIATAYPKDLLLTESDGPVSFAALEGAGGPYLMPTVVFYLAKQKGLDFWDMASIVAENGEAFLT